MADGLWLLLNVDMLDGIFCGEFKLDRLSLVDLSYWYIVR